MLANSTISTLVVYVNDLETSKTFYGKMLELRLLQENSSYASYAAGSVVLESRSARSDGVELAHGRDDASLIVFHVNDLDRMRSDLQARGVQFGETLRYEIGATAAFYDPDGHNITLYEPSPESMTWPSAAKIRELTQPHTGSDLLRDSPAIYLFLFVKSASEAFDFYHGKLGLTILEEDPQAGVVKYDGHSIILATHVVGGDSRCAIDMDLGRAKGVAPAFSVEDIGAAYRGLSASNIPFKEPAGEHRIPSTYFKDPNGHPIFIRSSASQPAPRAALA